MAKAKSSSAFSAPPVKVKIGDAIYTLHPTIASARIINDYFGGVFSNATQRIQAGDITAMVAVINAGTGGRMTGADEQALWEAIYTADDLVPIAKECIRYTAIMRNGGRPLPTVETTGKDSEAGESEGNAVH